MIPASTVGLIVCGVIVVLIGYGIAGYPKDDSDPWQEGFVAACLFIGFAIFFMLLAAMIGDWLHTHVTVAW